MANAAKQDAISRRFVGDYLYLVINSSSHMAGKLEVLRYYNSNSATVAPTITSARPCPSPRILQNPGPMRHCPLLVAAMTHMQQR
jgi:hypothetical protein